LSCNHQQTELRTLFLPYCQTWVREPKICVKATVHTSNIGQYGESKDHLEIISGQRVLNKMFAPPKKPKLLALIDGLGFRSNRAGLEGVLDKADEFCQFRTIWKAIVIANYELNHPLDFGLYLPKPYLKFFEDFLNRYQYPQENILNERPEAEIEQMELGDAVISIYEKN